jgi:asparagine synthase (glutamine-hydrolysing)
MCGICGMVGFSDGFDASERTVTAMSDTIAHRGPDDDGAWTDPEHRVALGHRRLSIVDLSPAGHNPMPNEDGTVWITYNGEVYNHLALRAELEAKGHVYRSHADTETILHLYEEEGPACVERLEGMFGFAIWDSRRRELFLARDRLGVKPLYYARTPGGFVFGSEIKAIIEHPQITADLDEEAFGHYLTFVSTPAPLTMFKGVSKLAPAERMVVSPDGSVKSDIWWTPMSGDAARDVAGRSEPELQERLLELLRDSVGKRMMSDVPFGVFLSGGVDSSTNVALMAELMDDPVRTYSVGFKRHEKYNELEYARRIATQFGTDHHEIVIDESDLADFLPAMIHHQDEPIADWVCVPLHFVSKLAREDGTIVVQIGEGSDELFHGYQLYIDAVARRQRYWEPFQRVPRPLRRAIGRSADRAANGRQPFWGGAIAWQGHLKSQLLANGHGSQDSYAIVERLWDGAGPDADVLQRMTYMELRQRLAELLLMRVDKMLMATSVEGREPFLDHHLVEFALALPPHFKVRDGVGKILLKRAVDGLIPHDLVYRKKMGFGAPVSEWFRGDLGVRAQREIRASSLAERGLIDYDLVDGLWEAHRAGQEWSFQLWNLYNVSAWHDYWVAGRALA